MGYGVRATSPEASSTETSTAKAASGSGPIPRIKATSATTNGPSSYIATKEIWAGTSKAASKPATR